ncbi:collagen-binding protein (plasmid) [Fulvitalea axinellae]|uniref:Collagen-binding protein n=1 Tax=Fulvitalea axinellae TaxID=1182444 RepID=A0AAU9CML9_9BACT|nr:collagen-binding protein [Fulvitalea axinellae]
MTKYAFSLLVTFFPLWLFAQQKHTLSGTLYDHAKGEPLVGATVHFDGTTIGDITDDKGRYSLAAPAGKYKLVVNYLGYQPIEKLITLDKAQTFDAKLKSDLTKLDAVVVRGEGQQAVDIRTPQMGVNKISSKKIKEIPAVLGEVDIIKSIQLLPGVTSNGEGDGGFNVRGGAGDQNLVLLDGATVYNTAHLFGFFSVFNADAISGIELYKGAAPAKYGGRASSVLNINHKDGEDDSIHLAGGIGILSSRLAVEGPTFKDKGTFLLAGRASYANVFLRLANFGSYAGFYDLNLKTDYRISDKDKIVLSGYFGDDSMELEDAFKNVYGNLSGTLAWKRAFNESVYGEMSLVFSRYRYNFQIFGQSIDWTAGVYDYKAGYDLAYAVNDKLNLDFGLSSIYHVFKPGDVVPTSPDSDINAFEVDQKYALENGVYTNAEHELSDKVTVQYGIRLSNFLRMGKEDISLYENDLPVYYNSELGIYESADPSGVKGYASGKVSKSFWYPEPRLGISVQLNPTSSVKAGYNRMVQYLHLISNTASITPLDVWAPSGQYIDPQIADQYAVGFFKNFKEEKYSLEIEAYYKTVQNRIDYIDGAELIAQERIETQILNGEARAYGLEVLLRKNQGRLTGWIAYTLAKSEQRALGGDAGGPGINKGEWYNTAYDRTHDLSVTGTLKVNEKWSLGGNFAFQTGRPVTYPNGKFEYNDLSVATYSQRNADRLPVYHRLDVSATLRPTPKKGKRWKGEWVFSVYNLYNRMNAASISFAENTDTGVNEATKTSIFGIIPSVTYNFKF